MRIDLTSDQWAKYETQYKNLMHKISYNINGDNAVTTANEDNYSELCIAALESINGFHKLTKENFDNMWKNPHFHKYTKTCLWNNKNSRGKKISKKLRYIKGNNNADLYHINNWSLSSPISSSSTNEQQYYPDKYITALDSHLIFDELEQFLTENTINIEVPSEELVNLLEVDLSSFQKKVLQMFLDDRENKLTFNSSGRINVRALCKALNLTRFKVNKLINEIESMIVDEVSRYN